MTTPQSARQTGFTLVELLVALTVTALVVVLVFAAFGVVGRSESRNQQQLDRGEQMLQVSAWLARKFDGLRPLERLDEGVRVRFFAGNAAGALWVAPLPERGIGGGLHVFRAGPLRQANGHTDLLIEATPYTGSQMHPDWSNALSQILMPNVTSLQWYYQDGLGGDWVQEWGADQPYYPARVMIQLGDEQGDWPPLVFDLPRAR